MVDVDTSKDESTLEQVGLVGHLHKTRLCSFFYEVRCKYGSACGFAHSDAELMPAPDFRYMHMCRAFLGGRCRRRHCKFAHGVQEVRQGAIGPPKDPPSRTRLSARSVPFVPACLQPARLPPGLSAPDGAPPRARCASEGPPAGAQQTPQTYLDGPDAAWSIGEDGSCATWAGSASDADAGDSRSSWEALRPGVPGYP